MQAALQSRKAYAFLPGEEAKTAAERRFRVALEKYRQTNREKQSWLGRIIGRPLTWAALATVAAAIFGIYFGISQTIYPISPIVPDPDPEGNFVLLISDDVNAISDFESVTVSITKVGILSSGSGKWIEFEPEIKEVDLTTVQGDESLQIWRGDIPEGEYTKIFIYISNVRGVLKESGQLENIKLPSNRLQISSNIQVAPDAVTSFTYDITVISTGNGQSGTGYILKPQADESGVDTKPGNNQGKGKQD